MSGIQVIAALFAGGMMYQTFLNFKRKDLEVGGVAFWEAIWLGLFVITLLPGPFQRLIGVIHVARLLDLVTIVGMLLLVAITYQLHVQMRRQRRSLETLVRSLALRDLPSETPPT